jgi:hypothetical protein
MSRPDTIFNPPVLASDEPIYPTKILNTPYYAPMLSHLHSILLSVPKSRIKI